MIRHLFKLIWHRKRRNFLMMLEISISFMVLYFVLVTIIFQVSNFSKPLGFDYEDVWFVNLDWKNQSPAQITETLRQMQSALDGLPQVETNALSNSMLFIPTAMSRTDFEWNGREVSSEWLEGDDHFHKVLQIPLLEGRWFSREDDAGFRKALVINRKLERELFADQAGLGQIITQDDEEYRIIGIIEDFRNSGKYTRSKRVAFNRINLKTEVDDPDFTADNFGKRILVRVRPGTPVSFEEELTGLLSSIAKDFTLKIVPAETAHQTANKTSLTLPIVLGVVCGFLIINVALGLFGIIWYNTSKRRSEIGLRRAMGSTIQKIYQQIIGESVVLSTFALIIGSIIVLQFPLLNVFAFIDTNVYLWAWLVGCLGIYGITLICALYPGKLAAETQPALALHEE